MDYSQLGSKRRTRVPHTTRVRNKIGLLALRVTLAVVLIGGFAAFGAGMGLWLGILRNAPELYTDGIFAAGMIERTSVVINMHTGEEMERLHAGRNFEHVSLNQIPLHVQNAFIAIEDERFREHNGIDIRAIGRAINVIFETRGARTEGASTITQQFIKNTLGRWDADIITKLQEQYLAVSFERQLTEDFARMGYENPRERAKDFILEAYLNIINLGRQNIGVQAAALFYYNVEVQYLTIAQAATIAAITQNPTRFPPDTRPEANWQRTQTVLDRMLRNGFITEEEHEEAMAYEILECGTELGLVYRTIFRVDGGGTRPLLSPFDCFMDAMLDQVRDDLMAEFGITRDQADTWIFTRGLQIESTQCANMQAIVDSAFLNEALWPGPEGGFTIEVEYHLSVFNHITQQVRHYRRQHTANSMAEAEAFIYNLQNELLTANDEIQAERRFLTPQPQGAFVLMDHHTGHVLAIRGIRGEKEGNRVFNRATQATRPPGSQLKPLAFAAAFNLGIMQPSTVIDDIPFTLIEAGAPPWSPRNHWGSNFRGHMTARTAIYASANVVSARAVADPTIPHLGVPAFHAFLYNLGINTLHENDGAAVVLGGMTHGVHLIELTGAYAAIANMGEFNRPMLYNRVLDYYGNVLLENRDGPQRVLSRNAAYLTIHSMMDTVTVGTGGRANWSNPAMRSGGANHIPIAGKTGTSQDNRDLGFAGSTPYFTAAFWIGNDNNTVLHRGTNQYHTPMWRHIMEEIHRDLPPRQFERPETIRTATVCRDSGHLATEFCRADPRGNRARGEVFAAGLVPTQECRVHQQFTYCEVSGHMAGHFCPPDHVITRVGMIRAWPIDHLTEYVRDRAHEIPLAVREGRVCYIHTEWYHLWGGHTHTYPGEYPSWYNDPDTWVSPFPGFGQPQPPQPPPYYPPPQQDPQGMPPDNPWDNHIPLPPQEEPPPPPDDPPPDVPTGHDSSWIPGGTP
ncbi:MAG: transglycosylase domain-containing protein [Defluviitaleaceae bacterium]|nr:transglycosylase domain-containing protein [Defluviitaleaceae bacterium]